jgi:hypothetical protein
MLPKAREEKPLQPARTLRTVCFGAYIQQAFQRGRCNNCALGGEERAAENENDSIVSPFCALLPADQLDSARDVSFLSFTKRIPELMPYIP